MVTKKKAAPPARYHKIQASRETKGLLLQIQWTLLDKKGREASQKELVDEAIALLAKHYRVKR